MSREDTQRPWAVRIPCESEEAEGPCDNEYPPARIGSEHADVCECLADVQSWSWIAVG